MEIFFPVDWVVDTDLNPRLPKIEIRDLNIQMNVNLNDSEENNIWLDGEELPEHIRVIDDEEFFNEYVD